MTNKTEIVRLLRLAWGADHVSAEDCRKIDALLAAPPQPGAVCYRYQHDAEPGKWFYTANAIDPQCYNAEPVTLSQLLAALPKDGGQTDHSAQLEGLRMDSFADDDLGRKAASHWWNAALDAAAKLGPLYAQPLDTVQVDAQAVFMVRDHGSDSWEEMKGESLEMCQCQPEAYEVRKFYTRADAREVERWKNLHSAMQLQLDHHRTKAKQFVVSLIDMRDQRDALQRRLATAEQLLLDVRDNGELCRYDVYDAVHAYLSASAKPE